MRRYLVAALALSLFAASTACKDDPAPTEIDVELFSSVAHLDRIHLKVRDQSVDRDRGYAWAELDVDNVGDRDLTTTPALVRLTQTEALKGKPFLLYATGFVTDAASGGMRLTVGGAITLQYVENTRQVKRVRLNADFLATDRDGDGFRTCGSFEPPTDPAEQNVLDESKNCDCNDNNDRINGFNFEICGDNIDNNCTGWPYDENCADCVEDQPCTTLPPEQWGLAGVGECTLGVFRCVPTVVDGVEVRRLLDVCEGSKGPKPEGTEANGRDDNCNGVVDELTPCLPGTLPRACYNGFIDLEATSELHGAKGECKPGSQRCVNGVWENQCDGQKLPQRPPRDNNEQERADPSFWSGIGFFELAIPTRGLDQCDGLDNDCDGFFDEEPNFDVDGDGYTYCGTGDSPPAVPRQHTVGGEFAHLEDCNDNDPNVHPGAVERCDDGIDNDCSCDHGPSITGDPTQSVSGRNCFNADTYLDCSRREGRANTDPGACDPTGGGTVYYAQFASNPSAPFRLYGCFPCRASYGYTCGNDGVTCANQAEGCCVENACPSNALIDATDASHAPVIYRPYCAEPVAGTCTCGVPPAWQQVAPHTEASAGGIRLDDREDCGAIDCTSYYLGVDSSDGRCYRRSTIPADQAFCMGKPLCAAGDTSPTCCNGETGANCCEGPGDRCNTWEGRGAEASSTRPTCQQVAVGTCVGQNGPTYQFIPVNTDPFNDCAGSIMCDGAGGCLKAAGETCASSAQCNMGLSCVDGVCCGASACGTCQACNVPGSLGTCTPISGLTDDTCNSECTYCDNGTCVTRPNGATDECGTCGQCNGGPGSCVGHSNNEGKNCNGPCTHCSSGSCVAWPNHDTTECGNCQECNGGGGACQNVPNSDNGGKGCIGPCNTCTNGVCVNRLEGDTTECATCQACQGGACVGQTANTGKNCANDCSSCVAGSCLTRGADSNVECGPCQRCDGSNVNCQAVDANEGPSCNGPCSRCTSGSCVGRAQFDFNECAAPACSSCNAPFGSCTVPSGAISAGAQCGGTNEYCCDGICNQPGGDLGTSCGSGACMGFWTCSGTGAVCSTFGQHCDSCSGDTVQERICDATGTCGGTPTNTTGCAVCTRCDVSGGLGSCVNRGYLEDDNDNPNTCNGNNTCNGGGNCLRENGQNCSSSGQCASNCCDDNGTGGCSGNGVCR